MDNVWQRVDHGWLRTVSRAADVGALYDGFDAVGLQYGPVYRALINAWAQSTLVRGRVTGPPRWW